MLAALACTVLVILHTLAVQGVHAAQSQTADRSAAQAGLLDCKPPAYGTGRQSLGVPLRPLQAGTRPNFIVILTDDLGWDDVGLHNPGYARTPNIDKFIRNGTLFDNFYVAPECAPTRAALLTGRHPLRTGTVKVNSGYDFIHSAETTAAQYLSAQGYQTAHFGKWHNIQTLGYEPWHVGFQQSWYIDTNLQDGAVWHNGNISYVQGYTEQRLAGVLLDYLSKAEARAAKQGSKARPFLVYYAPRAMHTGNGCQSKPGLAARCFPPKFRAPYRARKYSGIANNTLDAWAAAEYLDSVVGRVLDQVTRSSLAGSTYVLLASDNGAQLLPGEEAPAAKLIRMPSGMQGSKAVVLEGGIRNFLAVQGPGVEAGVTDSTLLDVTDILPTLAELAAKPGSSSSSSSSDGVDWSSIWDGISFANLLSVPAPGSITTSAATAAAADSGAMNGARSGARGVARATPQQQQRYLFAFGHQCWSEEALPLLGPNREVLRPQRLLRYDGGGLPGYLEPVGGEWLSTANGSYRGFEMCIAVRRGQYKWIGLTGKAYMFQNGSHIELPCNEVPQPQAAAIAAEFAAAARAWWAGIAAAPHSFTKPVFQVGLQSWNVTNVLAQGAHEISGMSAGNVRVLPNALAGFVEAGDAAWWSLQVLKPGAVSVVLMYTSAVAATFSVSLGSFQSIVDGSVLNITAVLPAQKRMLGVEIGTLPLPAPTSPPTKSELRLQLLSSTKPGTPIFTHLGNIQLTLGGKKNAKRRRPVAAGEEEEEDWLDLRSRFNWPDGQAGEESPYSPFDAEGIAHCEACQPPL
ncbi:hypothetical protein OEZ86_014587 [Tetradesmus obliquus]|nr:hypothetical protein OEZ86_014587 [Tetradesmus obliquus]